MKHINIIGAKFPVSWHICVNTKNSKSLYFIFINFFFYISVTLGHYKKLIVDNFILKMNLSCNRKKLHKIRLFFLCNHGQEICVCAKSIGLSSYIINTIFFRFIRRYCTRISDLLHFPKEHQSQIHFHSKFSAKCCIKFPLKILNISNVKSNNFH